MNSVLQKLEEHLGSIEGAQDELQPPATPEDLDAAEQELGVKFPEDFRQFYMWHNGNQGILFLFGSYRVFPIKELLELNRMGRETMDPELEEVSDESGVFKDCIANPNWIQFADNGGNTIVFIDMDPGQQGTMGQILEACDGEPECNFNGIKEFVEDITNRISTGKIAWNKEAGSFWETEG